MAKYKVEFFRGRDEATRASARCIVPIVQDLVDPQSVVDIGCGVGTWLSVFREHGVKDVLGVDGDYVDTRLLQIQSDEFLARDLTHSISLDRGFDLVVSLEVAEHLPPENATTFVESLTRLGSVVLFSAAIPLQGGVHHVNEQWPEFWVDLFLQRDYLALDVIRPQIWDDESVLWWYRQNLLLFCHRSISDAVRDRAGLVLTKGLEPLARVHPALWTFRNSELTRPPTLTSLPGLVVKTLSRSIWHRFQRRG